MESVNNATVSRASSADLGTVQGAASVSLLKKALTMQSAAAMQLLASVPQVPLATSGSVGTQVNTFA